MPPPPLEDTDKLCPPFPPRALILYALDPLPDAMQSTIMPPATLIPPTPLADATQSFTVPLPATEIPMPVLPLAVQRQTMPPLPVLMPFVRLPDKRNSVN